MKALIWPDWRDGPFPLTLTGLLAQALGTLRSDPLAYPVLVKFPVLERDARQLVQACLDGDEAQVIIDVADRYLRTLFRVRRESRFAGTDKAATTRAADRFAQAEQARRAMQAQLALKKSLAAVQPTLF